MPLNSLNPYPPETTEILHSIILPPAPDGFTSLWIKIPDKLRYAGLSGIVPRDLLSLEIEYCFSVARKCGFALGRDSFRLMRFKPAHYYEDHAPDGIFFFHFWTL